MLDVELIITGTMQPWQTLENSELPTGIAAAKTAFGVVAVESYGEATLDVTVEGSRAFLRNRGASAITMSQKGAYAHGQAVFFFGVAFRIPWRDESERGPAEWDEHDACRVRRAVQIKTSRSSVAGCGADVRVRIRDGLRVQRCDGRLRYLRRQRLARPSRPSGRMDRRSVTSAESYTPHTSRKTNALLSYTTPEAPVPEASFLSCPTRLFSLM